MLEGTIVEAPTSNGLSRIAAGISMWDVSLRPQNQSRDGESRGVARLQGLIRRQKKLNTFFVTIHMCDAHSAYFLPLAAYELSWPANFHWLYVEGLFYESIKEHSCWRTNQHPSHCTRKEHRRYDDRCRQFHYVDCRTQGCGIDGCAFRERSFHRVRTHR